MNKALGLIPSTTKENNNNKIILEDNEWFSK
jgi:hypothetical protein